MTPLEAALIVLDAGLPASAAVEPASAEVLVVREGAGAEPEVVARLLAALADPSPVAALAAGDGDGTAVLAMRRRDADLLEGTVAAPGEALAKLRQALARRGRVETIGATP